MIVEIDGHEVNTRRGDEGAHRRPARAVRFPSSTSAAASGSAPCSLRSLTRRKTSTAAACGCATRRPGIGTVTYVNAADHTFGGLGHGICDVETGELLPMLRGVVVDVEITGVEKGRKNDPGELRGQSVALSARTAGAEYRRRRVRQLR